MWKKETCFKYPTIYPWYQGFEKKFLYSRPLVGTRDTEDEANCFLQMYNNKGFYINRIKLSQWSLFVDNLQFLADFFCTFFAVFWNFWSTNCIFCPMICIFFLGIICIGLVNVLNFCRRWLVFFDRRLSLSLSMTCSFWVMTCIRTSISFVTSIGFDACYPFHIYVGNIECLWNSAIDILPGY